MECDGGGAVNWRDVERGSGGLDGEVDIFGGSARSAGADKYYTCQKQIIDINQLNPVLPPPPEEKPDF